MNRDELLAGLTFELEDRIGNKSGLDLRVESDCDYVRELLKQAVVALHGNFWVEEDCGEGYLRLLYIFDPDSEFYIAGPAFYIGVHDFPLLWESGPAEWAEAILSRGEGLIEEHLKAMKEDSGKIRDFLDQLDND